MKLQTRKAATIFLLIMLFGFIATLFFNNKIILLLLQSGFEAGLVGGLADWFAVTALFRHPLGIPIPHTALLPSNRERITKALVSTVENDLLNKSSIIGKIQQMDMARKLLGLCDVHMDSKAVKTAIINISRGIVNSISLPDTAAFIQSLAAGYAAKLDSGKLLEMLADEGLKRGYDREIFDNVLDRLEDIAKSEDIQKRIGSTAIGSIKKLHGGGMLQYTLSTVAGIAGENKIGGIIQELLLSVLHDLKNPDHPNRHKALELLAANVRELCSDEALIKKLDGYKDDLIISSSFNDVVVMLLHEIKGTILSHLEDEAYIDETVLPYLREVIKRISMNDEMVGKLDMYIQEQTSDFIDSNHKKIGKLVEENIHKFDNDTLIRLIEDKVGNDLQWIRINGAVCGFLIGIILGLIKLSGFIGV